jgi:sarcosine oxidase, subunit beta
MNEFVETILDLSWPQGEPKKHYDVVIIGAGGHGLATAYYLATRHGITNVAVIEKGYIGSGNSGRNTTIIRANYGLPESIQFYAHSQALYGTLEAETGCEIMHAPKGLMWLAHTETAMRAERARCLLNQAMGVNTVEINAAEAKVLCPQLDTTGGGRYPIVGGSYHVPGSTARHDRVVWAYAQGAMRRGVEVFQNTAVTGLLRDGDRVTGVRTPRGDISAGTVLSAVGGDVTSIANMAGVRVPIRTHQLQAFVTNAYAQELGPIVSSSELLCYVSQTARGQLLIGHEFERQSSYARNQSTFQFLASCSAKVAYLLPFVRRLRILRQWTGICDVSADFSPIMGYTGADGFLISTGWGTWGFKAIPAGGEQLAELIATGRTPDMIAPFSIDRFAANHAMADQGSTGTR